MPSREEREQIKDRIAQLKDQREELREAVRHHYREQRQRPQDGFQGRGVETQLSRVQAEIDELYERLKGGS